MLSPSFWMLLCGGAASDAIVLRFGHLFCVLVLVTCVGGREGRNSPILRARDNRNDLRPTEAKRKR